MKTGIIAIILIVVIFVIWWIKGMRDGYVLKDKILFILVNNYGLSRIEAIYLFDRHHRYVFELNEIKSSPFEIAQKLYELL